jgi:putative ABC transport system permease protein
MGPEPSRRIARWRELIVQHAGRHRVDLPFTVVDELAAHMDDIYAAALGQGEAAPEAEDRVRRALDDSPLHVLRAHALRDQRRQHARREAAATLISGKGTLDVMNALRTAIRQFRHHPTFALATVLVLGLGTGAATAVFTVVDAVVLRPLPYRAPDRLVTIWDTNTEKGLSHEPLSPVTFLDYRELPVFADAAAWWRPSVNLADPGLEPVRVNTIEAGGNLFSVLGVRPQIGPGFPENGPQFHRTELIAVISDRLWRSRYNADPSIIGRQLAMDSLRYTIVGVMAPAFHYPGDIDVWQRSNWNFEQHSRQAHFMEAVARLADGTTLEEAQTATDTLAIRLQGEFPTSNKGWSARVVPLLEDQLGYYKPALMVLFGAVGLLLVIGCLNVASLLLTRALSREREIAVRIAMGASPRQLLTQLLAESSVLSIAGTLAGVLAAAVALPIVLRLTPVQIPRLHEAGLDLSALGLSVAVVVVTTLFFGMVPALILLRAQVATGLRTGERGSARGARTIYSALVAAEVALACALLVSSALLVRTVARMMDTPTGVDAHDVLTTPVQLAGVAYANWRVTADAHSTIIDAVRQQPGIVAAGGGNFLPLEVGWRMPIHVLGEAPPARPEDAPRAQFHSVSDGFFEALGVQFAQGRAFLPSDTADSVPVAIVNETFADRYLGGRSAVSRVVLTTATGIGPLGLNLMRPRPAPASGQHAPPPPPTPFEIVGVVKDVRNVPLGQSVEPAVYFTTRQFPFRELFLAVRGTDTATAMAAVRNALKAAAPNVPMAHAQTWGERFAARTAQSRLLMTILVFFGALAGVLAAVGVYGLFSWSVALRRRELAIRLTLGAHPASVGRLVVRHSLVLIAIGLAVGLALIWTFETALARVLYQVSPSDPAAVATASGLLLAAALIASIPPAVRAMRVDPAEGLRLE